MPTSIVTYNTKFHTDTIQTLFREYEQDIGIDLCFQYFRKELENLPGRYAPPDGALLLATRGTGYAGCVAMRKLDSCSCEMKRLYVRHRFRNLGVGNKLAREIIFLARQGGYAHMYLDTLETMEEALSLYRSLGFTPVDPYYDNPLENVVYLQLDLRT